MRAETTRPGIRDIGAAGLGMAKEAVGALKEKYNTAKENSRKEEKRRTVDEYLAKPEVMAFLDKDTAFDVESFDFNNEEALDKLIERSKTIEVGAKVNQGLKKLYRNEIRQTVGVDVKEEDLAALDGFIEDQITNNPEALRQLERDMELFNREVGSQIAEKSKVFKKGNLAELQEKDEDLQKLHRIEYRPFYHERTTEERQQREQILEKYGIEITDLKKELKASKADLKAGKKSDKEIEKIKKKFGDLRTKLLRDIEPALIAQEVGQKMAREKMYKMGTVEGRSFEQLQESKKRLVDEVSRNQADRSGLDVTSNAVDLEGAEEAFNQEIEIALENELSDIAEKTPAESDAIALYIKKFRTYFLAKEIAGKTGAEKNELLAKKFGALIRKPGLPNSKKIAIKRMCQAYKLEPIYE